MKVSEIFLFFIFSPYLFAFLVFGLVQFVWSGLRRSNKQLLDDIEVMKVIVRSEHNRVEEVIERVEGELASTKLIRHGADRDLVQAKKSIEDLTAKLSMAEKNWASLWQSFRMMASLLRTLEDNRQTWGQFIPLIPVRLQGFVKRATHICIKNVLAYVRVLAPSAPLEKLAEGAKSQEYLEAIERAEPKVDALAGLISEQLDIKLPPLDDVF